MQKLYSAENVTVSHSDEDVRDKSYPSSSSTTPAGPDHIADYADCNLDPLPLPEPITFDEVHHAASRLKKGRSPGVDGISSDLIRQSEVLQRWVYELCSKCFEVESQPSEWLRSKVTLTKKAGKPPNEVGSYRTVMAQVSAAKVYSAVVLERISEHLDSRLHHSQCGFRKSRSTTEVIHATNILRDGCLAHGRSLCLLVADWQRAFDKLDRQYMMKCLRAADLHPKYLRIIDQSYNEAVACLTLGGETCEVKLSSGVKQGDVWSPIIFVTSLDEVLRRSIISAGHGFRLTKEDYHHRRYTRFAARSAILQEPIGCICFADDVTAPSESIEDSEKVLRALEIEGQPANLTLGIGSTGCKTKRLLINCKQPTSHGRVDVVKKFRQLGVLITDAPGYGGAVKDRIRTAGAALHKLRDIWKSHDIGLDGKMIIMRSVVFASLFYGSEALAINKEEEQMYRTFYHICLRRVLGVAPMTRLSSRSSRRAGRPRQTWIELVKQDMNDSKSTYLRLNLFTQLEFANGNVKVREPCI
ncbi:conserved hypothetical protein [Perkinsus marinus ATCC 50983]|uniref:Reverse transcriptase domain-containing protein n=1 Tax=Perkinsus marinus (strain ATCC 50983 / TXsc) TaxID=423536 RepID=C5KLC5_PERM5|nr:conserved hypothetical protein [Perkinsus marinus ATCC 50983]XP_002783002.1 conserved hypothetical protein [Perkinsus marinus ATCC 50983]EEQ97506.1 conserved hypothetical protein [Perkinsus marinus ATCC 50983]EER14798.1 conserved hypothetical protein [Perkinsus marinus ATCC 50983]|eukprot:XP_002764789.1 conserved hypothetical protein [Perkinsus marinus ATCC 50983]